jgi:[ribosomal protein S18]-alanine N-acetyltransferase
MDARFDKPLSNASRPERMPRQAVALSPAAVADARAFAALHATAFRRGWSSAEFERLLGEPNVLADRATVGALADHEMVGELAKRHSANGLAGFVLSRLASDQSDILAIVVAVPWRRRGLARMLMDAHLRRLAHCGIAAVFLEVDERNLPARRLYAGLDYREVGRRPNYYDEAGEAAGTALVLRRDLASDVV